MNYGMLCLQFSCVHTWLGWYIWWSMKMQADIMIFCMAKVLAAPVGSITMKHVCKCYPRHTSNCKAWSVRKDSSNKEAGFCTALWFFLLKFIHRNRAAIKTKMKGTGSTYQTPISKASLRRIHDQHSKYVRLDAWLFVRLSRMMKRRMLVSWWKGSTWELKYALTILDNTTLVFLYCYYCLMLKYDIRYIDLIWFQHIPTLNRIDDRCTAWLLVKPGRGCISDVVKKSGIIW